MYVRFWGTRGSIATPGPQTAYYGGNTSCVEVRADDGTLIILDCGTGARELGLHLLRGERRPLHLHLFIGHTHWDHIQGFLFLIPLSSPKLNSTYMPHAMCSIARKRRSPVKCKLPTFPWSSTIYAAIFGTPNSKRPPFVSVMS